MKHTGLFKTLCFCAGCLLLSACVDYSDIQPFDGKTLPRKSGYTTGVTNDWIYFNLRTGEIFNALGVNRDIKEGGQMNRTDWDLAFCGYVWELRKLDKCGSITLRSEMGGRQSRGVCHYVSE